MLKEPHQLDSNERDRLAVQVSSIFSPNAPISDKQLFSGRSKQIGQLIDVVFETGRHAIVYGERGVGKTSLVKVLPKFIEDAEIKEIIPVRVACVADSTTENIWLRIFALLADKILNHNDSLSQGLAYDGHSSINPPYVLSQLKKISDQELDVVIIIDEIDAVTNDCSKKEFSEAIKLLSDDEIRATLILVGVSTDVEDLIAGHQSIERNLLQIHMPRMSPEECRDIILKNGLDKLSMGIHPDCIDQILYIANGLPHFVHLLTKNAAKNAVLEGVRNIAPDHLRSAINVAIDETHQSLKNTYVKATSSPRRNFNRQVLLACSLTTDIDDLGRFAAKDIRDHYQRIMKDNKYDVEHFVKNLTDLCSEARGSILVRSGSSRSHRYRFNEPLMQSYIKMMGVHDGLIDPA